MPAARAMVDYAALRERMTREQLEERGIRDPAVLSAFRKVPREAFLTPDMAHLAYQDSPLPIGAGQTISQPYCVAMMIEALELSGNDKVLEIGTGSGYAAAILGCIAREVHTVERHLSLVEAARRNLAALGFQNVHVHHGDGSLGWSEHAPYDAILVSAAAPRVPPALKGQLAVGGRLLVPVGDPSLWQELIRVRRVAPDEFREENLGGVRFVPLVGAQGWPESSGPEET